MTIILASASSIRRTLLERAGVSVSVDPARLDEAAIRDALLAEKSTPRDIADYLAEQKARRVAMKHGEASLVLGSDQVLDFDGGVLGKAETPAALREQLFRLRGNVHKLHAAAVIFEGPRPVWRHVSTVALRMHDLSDSFVDDYIARNWDDVRHSVGGYHMEDEGPRLFSRIDGSYFAILGLPLLEVLSYLSLRGELVT